MQSRRKKPLSRETKRLLNSGRAESVQRLSSVVILDRQRIYTARENALQALYNRVISMRYTEAFLRRGLAIKQSFAFNHDRSRQLGLIVWIKCFEHFMGNVKPCFPGDCSRDVPSQLITQLG